MKPCLPSLYLTFPEISANEVDFSETALSLNQYYSILVAVQCRKSIRVGFAHKETDK